MARLSAASAAARSTTGRASPNSSTSNAAFLIQKGMYEYSRARAGHYAKVLLQEPEFLEAIEKARWQGYPLGLAMVGEMVEGMLHEGAGTIGAPCFDGSLRIVLSVFDRYPVPPPIGAADWQGCATSSPGASPPCRCIRPSP